MDWQPIETAPKIRGAKVLLYDEDLGVCIGYWPHEDGDELGGWWAGYVHEDGQGLDDCCDACAYHWMPLPAAPPKRPRQYKRRSAK